jgi:hypothetical protein
MSLSEQLGNCVARLVQANGSRDFNNTVNMTADELEQWLKEPGSQESGWSKDDGSGESIGHER